MNPTTTGFEAMVNLGRARNLAAAAFASSIVANSAKPQRHDSLVFLSLIKKTLRREPALAPRPTVLVVGAVDLSLFGVAVVGSFCCGDSTNSLEMPLASTS